MVIKPAKTLMEDPAGKIMGGWVKLDNTVKKLSSSDLVILGDSSVRRPAVVGSTNVPAVKARIVTNNNLMLTSDTPNATLDYSKLIKVVKELDFNGEKSMTWSPDSTLRLDKDFWLEVYNPTNSDAVVDFTVNCLFKSKTMM